MERSRHFGRNEHHSRHHRRDPSPGLPSKKKSAHRSRHDTHHGQHPGEEMNDKSYVESWLQQTSALEDTAHARDVAGSRLKGATTARGYWDTRVTDSSIIQRPSPPRPREKGMHHHVPKPHLEPEYHMKQARPERKRRRASPSSSAESEISDRSVTDKGRYEKRARHKTREDKYEPGHGGPSRRKAADEKPARSRVREKDRKRDKKKKNGLTTSKELMGKFSSDAIHNDRLTMLPSMQRGIFGNSRLDKAPGDLTFGDMAFLKEPKAQEPVKKASKSRSSESKKRDQQELENISVFFSHKKHDANGPSKVRKTTEHDAVARHSTVAPSIHGFVKDRSRASTPGKATSYISWSSSHYPAERQSERQVELPGRSPTEERLTEQLAAKRASSSRVPTPTPDSIRRMLKDSGLYRFPSSARSEREQQENRSPARVHRSDRKEDTPSQPPLSRAVIAQQAYIKLKKVTPRIRPVKVALPTKEVPPSPKLPSVVQSPLRPTPFDHTLSQDPSPKPKSLDAPRHQQQISPRVQDRQQKEAPSHEVHRSTIPSMIPPPEIDALVARQPPLPRPALGLPRTHFNPRESIRQPSRAESTRSYLYSFRPLSVLSSRPSLHPHGGGRALYSRQSNHSPYEPVSFRQPEHTTSSIWTPTGMAPVQSNRENARPSATRGSRMLEYINQLESEVFSGFHEDSNFTTPALEQAQDTGDFSESFSTEMQHSYLTRSRFDADQHVSWRPESKERYGTEYQENIHPSTACFSQGYEDVGSEQINADDGSWPPRLREQQPRRPGTALGGGIADEVTMYWKPNTCGL